MKNNKEKCIEYISQIFSFCVEAKIHFEVITDVLGKSNFIKNIENSNYSYLNEKTPFEIFVEIFDKDFIDDNNYMKYDSSYWCGYVYSQIFYEYNKPFSYIFLKMPLEKLINMYEIYHEMDIGQSFEQFEIEMNKETILRLLLKKHCISGAELSRRTGVSTATINNMKKDDDALYNASFKIVQRIASTLDEPGNMFLERINEL